MPDIKNFDYSPQLYDKQVDWLARISRERYLFEKIITGKKVKKILDIGCGTGHHVQLFAEILESNAKQNIIEKQDIIVIGADPSEETVKFAAEKVVTSKAARLIVGGFEN
ncbi:MAG: class I SAM-dependent methyltransferase, partial [Actinobacteria bacterium]|nr:class I SAM-dependent methyltransferase [Actinomycetota bacterium]